MEKGMLYLVATPIGNLEDMTFRAIRILKEADIIAAEDTRHTKKLLNHFDIHTPLTSYFEHNKKVKGQFLLGLLQEGKTVALVSDAGMPGISDPGEDLVREAVKAGVTVSPIPGVSASIAALVVSGLPTDKFVFEGFLPREKKERRQRTAVLLKETRTMILYESPYRLLDTLKEMAEMLGDRKAVVAREITKQFEELVRGSFSELISHFSEKMAKGEITLLIAGAPEEQTEPPKAEILIEEMKSLLASGLSRKEAAKEIARRYAVSKSEIYNLSLSEESR